MAIGAHAQQWALANGAVWGHGTRGETLRPQPHSPPGDAGSLSVWSRMADAVLAALGAAAPFLRPGERERLAAQTRPFDPRSECFVPHPREEFVRGRVMGRQGGEVTVQTELGEVGIWGIGVGEGRGKGAIWGKGLMEVMEGGVKERKG